jgi:PAS domain S-box-containing protein
MRKAYPDPTCRAEVADYMHSLAPGWREWNVATKNGGSVPSEWANVRLTDDTRVGIGIDLRAHKEAEKALRKSKEDLARAQLVGHIGSWRLDVRNNVLTWSEENHRIFGIPKGTPMKYETFLAVVHPDDRSDVDRKWNAALQGEPYDIEHRIVVEGALRWVREKAYLEFDDDGELLGGFGITQDITPRKRAEQRLVELNETLEQRVEERTEALRITLNRLRDQQAQLRQLAVRLSQAREDERQRIAVGLHDDVGQLLAAVQYRLESARRNKADGSEDFEEADRLVTAAVEHIRDLVFDLRCPTLHEVGLAEALKELAGRVEDMFQMPIELEVDASMRPVPQQLRPALYQAVGELLFNVHKHAEAGYAAVCLACADGAWHITVADDGKGMAQEVSLLRAHDDGFGLLHLREQFRAFGGQVLIESETGHGTKVTLRVPLSAGDDARAAEEGEAP